MVPLERALVAPAPVRHGSRLRRAGRTRRQQRWHSGCPGDRRRASDGCQLCRCVGCTVRCGRRRSERCSRGCTRSRSVAGSLREVLHSLVQDIRILRASNRRLHRSGARMRGSASQGLHSWWNRHGQHSHAACDRGLCPADGLPILRQALLGWRPPMLAGGVATGSCGVRGGRAVRERIVQRHRRRMRHLSGDARTRQAV